MTEVYAVVLGEENIYWNGASDVLNHLYNYVKAQYNVPVYQWYSPSAHPPSFGYPLLNADGWISDEYWRGDGIDYVTGFAEFEQFIRCYLVLGKPLIHLLWAAPDFDIAQYEGFLIFKEQLDVCRKYNVPTAYFVYAPELNTWAWYPNAPPASQDMWQTILDERFNGMAVSDNERFAHWDEVASANPVELKFETSNQALYEDNFIAAYTTPAKFLKDTTITGFRDLVWNNAEELVLRASDNGQRSICLVYEFFSVNTMHNIGITIAGTTISGATNTVEISLDRVTWLPASQASNLDDVSRFWVRVNMTATQATKGVITNTLNLIRVSADKK